MFEIPQEIAEQIGDFDKKVLEYIQALEAHRFIVGAPAPTPAHPIMEHCVKRVQHPVPAAHQPMREHTVKTEDGELVTTMKPEGEPVHFMSSTSPDEFVSDYKIIPYTLEDRKKKLDDMIAATVNAAVDAILPPRKRAYVNMLLGEASGVEEKDRTPEQQAALLDHEAREKQFKALHLWSAKQVHDIEDLTEQNIDHWKPEPLPT